MYALFVFNRIGCLCEQCDHTYQYMRNMFDATTVEKLLKRIQAEKPVVKLSVACSHSETRGSGDNERTVTVVTYRAVVPVIVLSSTDATVGMDEAIRDITGVYGMTKVKLTKSLVPDAAFEAKKRALYEANKHRDAKCTVTESLHIAGFERYILAYADGEGDEERPNRRRNWVSPHVYMLAHLLLYPALPYRMWLCSITGVVKLDIRKSIVTQE